MKVTVRVMWGIWSYLWWCSPFGNICLVSHQYFLLKILTIYEYCRAMENYKDWKFGGLRSWIRGNCRVISWVFETTFPFERISDSKSNSDRLRRWAEISALSGDFEGPFETNEGGVCTFSELLIGTLKDSHWN